jgi:hypothetical protein
MPKWVENNLVVRGPKEELSRFITECFSWAETRPYLDFNRLIPMPSHIRSIVEEITGGGEQLKGDLSDKLMFPDWYVWNVNNWGTKWNACCTSLRREEELLKLSFQTASSIPWPIYDKLSDAYPQLHIEGEISELVMCIGGHIYCHDGKVEYDDKSQQERTKESKAARVKISCAIEHETSKALLINFDEQKAWLPKSEIEFDGNHDGTAVVMLPEWLAKARKLV